MQESGHYSIAGFFFQLLASADDALKLYFANTSPESLYAVFTVERFGQDGFISYPDSGRLRMIQYKYSSTGAALEPNDLREILIAFKKSIDAAKASPPDVDCYLTTNRPLSTAAECWFEGNAAKKMPILEFRKMLHCGTAVKMKNALPYTKFHPMFDRLRYDLRDLDGTQTKIQSIANSYGMLEHELETGITRVIGLLNKLASSTTRTVNRQKLIESLVGRKTPLSLTSARSMEEQKSLINAFKRNEGSNTLTIHRSVVSDIAEAAAQHPFVVVVGEGGCGKTVTVCDAAIDNLSTVGVPPGFAMVVKAHKLNRCSIQDTVRRWVNQLENPDMFAMDQTLARLEKAIPLFPVLTLYIDGVDERHGWQDLSTEARDFLCELIYSAQDSVRNGMPRFSVVVTCRHERELQGIGGGGFPLAAMPVSYSVSEFKLGDLAELAKKLGGCPRVGRRINDHISTRQGISYAAPSIEAPVDPERIEIIRHPVFWRCFEGLSDLQKHCFLDGIPDSLEEIATSYINWFFRKVSARVGDLQLNAAQTAMRYAATRFVSNDPFREADLREDWLGPCESAQCPSTHRMPIFQEAVSAGLIESEGSKEKWRWKRPWLCEYFAKEEGINV